MVSIRISDRDFSEVKARCAESGGANVSEFVRTATMHALGSPETFSSPAFSGIHLTALERRLERLEAQVSALVERLSAGNSNRNDAPPSDTRPASGTGQERSSGLP